MSDSDRYAITKAEENSSSDNVSLDSEHSGENIMIQTQDPHSLGENLTEAHALMNFIKGNIGSGILSMPVVLRYAGLWTGLVMILFAGILATYLMHVLVRVANSVRLRHALELNNMDYTETVFNVFKYGPYKLRKPKGKIKHAVNLFLIITQIGFSCVYTLFITENTRFFLGWFYKGTPLNFYIVALIVCVLLVPMCLTSNLRILAHVAAIANVATLIGTVLIFAYLFWSGLGRVTELPAFTNTQGVLVAFGIVMYSFEGISLVLPIQSKMAHPEVYSHPCGVLNCGMISIVCMNALFAFFGYLRFGDKAVGSITLNIPEYPFWFAPIKPLFVLAIVVTYLLQFYIPASIFSRLMEKLRCHREASDRRRYVHIKLMRVALVMFAYIMVVAIPKLELMISLIGSLASSMLAFVLPSVLEVVHLWPERNSISWFWLTILTKHTVIILIGLISFLGGSVATMMQLIEAFGKPENPS
ncbi:Proton-coupled amino acid transporter 1 [Fasciolopsis buskii]|uniref:Proton-coupled amino acid transporter 1 n=1 Tax=Fasciolopsis buskii TaxID=27845 RepID=A0A8E0VFZ3_9TREM|nr:Proton-coupled amino acid transporter 1 [Fasciolopsis buski]